ncbi:lipopolysaccharide biosynthesis protein [Paraburkholderia silvatlantica]|uniref:PST family polysaccharide transporter n=1 Tax=Paraburkholderia silvatlantica TaxID=321895 RepID=A0ABR6FYD4_9BURK|nr:oligosaccharide flippase family protein [Paraburkholderia silvatlantica]MBB2932431.1 PST family polysaccharide transporter [Paraburkholderia silvatlantica]PVY21608.1 PST family polysaccharide transporter [Paraburkholderia silvatlantica]PXW26917.1 PST family polysaccharide transporter [Paraburkholderia silvatlantica]
MNKVQASLSKIELLAVYFSYVVRYIYPLILVPYYGRVLGSNGYAVVLAGMSLSSTIWLCVDFGFSTIGGRDIVHTENISERDAIFRDQFTARLLLCIPGMIVGGIAACRSGIISGVPGVSFFVVVGGLLNAFNLGWYFTSTGRPRTSVMIEMLGLMLSLTLLFSFIRKPADIDRVFPVIFASNLAQTMLAYWLVRKEYTGVIAPLRAAINLIKRSATIFIYSGTAVLVLAASTYILSLLASPSEVSAFGLSERLVSAGLSIMAPASQILAPKVMYLVTRNEARANLLARRTFAIFFVGAVAGVILTKLLSEWLVPLLFGPEFVHAVPILKIMVLVMPLAVCTRVLGMYFLIPRKLERLLAVSGVTGALVNLAAAVPLAGYWGATGMVLARLLAEGSLLAMLVIGSWRAGLLRDIFGIDEGSTWQTRFGRWLE